MLLEKRPNLKSTLGKIPNGLKNSAGFKLFLPIISRALSELKTIPVG